MELPIGYDTFGEVIENQLDFVDKSLFIKDIFDNKRAKVVVITRPRRFGKTLTLSMLHHFLAPEVDGTVTRGMFDRFKIASQGEGYMQEQGKHPVIFITFKGVKDHGNFKEAYDKLCELIVETFNKHNYLESSDRLSRNSKTLYQIILSRNANPSQIEGSLKTLTTCLYEHHGVKPWLLIDEYDTPIQAGYLCGYYDKIISVMRGIFGAALKNNPSLKRSVITGILRVARESLFSDVNNLKMYSLLHKRYSQYFGFTEEEVSQLLEEAQLQDKVQQVKDWYNGYQFGETIVYNPWSIANCIDEEGELEIELN